MGYDAYAHAAYGVKVSEKDLEKIEKVSGCEAEFGRMRDGCPNSISKFCPECGQPPKAEQMVEVDLPEKVEFLKAFDENNNGILGFEMATAGSGEFRTVQEPTAEDKALLLKTLKELGIKEEPKLYIFLYESV